ncbi:MAG: hypothetical protein OES69_03615 [Myxococcales bacterium]|nr:hypothetical protein [Myxococcales bacterium]MDH3843000.1 hypothetical protein [Myxococcales bacterium]
MFRTLVILGVLAIAPFAIGCGGTDGDGGSGGNGGSGGVGGDGGTGGMGGDGGTGGVGGDGGTGGVPPSCTPGSLVATAWIDVRSVSETQFSTDGVIRSSTCNGEDFLAKKSGAFRLQVVVNDGVDDDDTIGSNIPTFGIATTDDDIFSNGSQLLQCSISIPPTILCMSFDFSDGAGNPAFPNDSVFVVVY